MEVQQAGTGLGESLSVLLRVGDHQMDVVERIRHGLVQALEHRDAEADVRHEVAVHHIIMQHFCAGIQHHAAVCAELAEVSRKDRRTDRCHFILLPVVSKRFFVFLPCRRPLWGTVGIVVYSLHENGEKIKPAAVFFTEKT